MTRPRRRRWITLARELPASLAALIVAVIVECGLRFTTLPTLARWLGIPLASATVPTPLPGPPPPLPARAKAQVRATRRVMSRWPFGDTCLRQALVSGHRLRRLGPQLHVGVAKIDGEIRAHAWLSIGGGILDPLAAAASYHDLPIPSPR